MENNTVVPIVINQLAMFVLEDEARYEWSYTVRAGEHNFKGRVLPRIVHYWLKYTPHLTKTQLEKYEQDIKSKKKDIEAFQRSLFNK